MRHKPNRGMPQCHTQPAVGRLQPPYVYNAIARHMLRHMYMLHMALCALIQYAIHLHGIDQHLTRLCAIRRPDHTRRLKLIHNLAGTVIAD